MHGRPKLAEFDKMISKPDAELLVKYARVRAEQDENRNSTMDYMMVLAILKAGLRASEIGILRTQDCHLNQNPPFIMIAGKKRKPDEKDEVMIPPSFATLLKQWIVAEGEMCKEFVFPSRDPRYGEVRKLVWMRIKQLYMDLNLPVHLNVHSLRHRFGTDTYNSSGHDLHLTMKQLRHKDLTSTQKYIHFSKMESKEVGAFLEKMGK